MEKKLITVCVPVYNENQNIRPAYERITAVMRELSQYDYEIVFFDDGSTDGSAELIGTLCAEDPHVKAVVYSRNFGYSKNVFYCMQQAKGDAAVIVHCDLQNPPEEIPRLAEQWEKGADVVLTVKNKSRENRFAYFLRTLCYFIANVFFGMKIVPHSTEFELFDRSFLNVLGQIETQTPFLRGFVQTYAKNPAVVYYTQDKRRAGKSHFSLSKYYDFAVEGMVNTSRCLPRRFLICSLLGMAACALEFFIRFLPARTGMPSALFWDGLLLRFGILALLVLLLAVSLLFEFVIAAGRNRDRKPTVTEKKRINY